MVLLIETPVPKGVVWFTFCSRAACTIHWALVELGLKLMTMLAVPMGGFFR